MIYGEKQRVATHRNCRNKKNFLDLFLLSFLLKLQIFLNCLQKYIICYSIFGNLFDFFTFCKIKKQKLCENIAILC